MTKNTGSPTTPIHTRSFTLITDTFWLQQIRRSHQMDPASNSLSYPPLAIGMYYGLSQLGECCWASRPFSVQNARNFKIIGGAFTVNEQNGLTGALYECVVNRYFLTSVYACKGLQILHWYVWDRAAHYSAQHAPVCHPDTSKTIIGDGNRPVTLQLGLCTVTVYYGLYGTVVRVKHPYRRAPDLRIDGRNIDGRQPYWDR